MRAHLTFLIMGSALLVLAPTPGHAQDCAARFVELMIGTQKFDQKYKLDITQEMKGGPKTVGVSYMIDAENWLSMTLDPPNIDWSLARDNVLYVSSDKGKSWKKVRVLDEQSSQEAVLKDQIENSKTVRDAQCGTEDFNGAAHETVEATYDTLQNFKFATRVKYWLDPVTARPVKATFDMKGEGFENFSTQLISIVPDYELPVP